MVVVVDREDEGGGGGGMFCGISYSASTAVYTCSIVCDYVVSHNNHLRRQ